MRWTGTRVKALRKASGLSVMYFAVKKCGIKNGHLEGIMYRGLPVNPEVAETFDRIYEELHETGKIELEPDPGKVRLVDSMLTDGERIMWLHGNVATICEKMGG